MYVSGGTQIQMVILKQTKQNKETKKQQTNSLSLFYIWSGRRCRHWLTRVISPTYPPSLPFLSDCRSVLWLLYPSITDRYQSLSLSLSNKHWWIVTVVGYGIGWGRGVKNWDKMVTSFFLFSFLPIKLRNSYNIKNILWDNFMSSLSYNMCDSHKINFTC